MGCLLRTGRDDRRGNNGTLYRYVANQCRAGRAYSIPYGGGDGLNFKAVLKEYSMKMDKKGNAVIEFIARNPEDRYEYRIKVFPNGSASIDVNMQNRQSISFQGELYIKEEK